VNGEISEGLELLKKPNFGERRAATGDDVGPVNHVDAKAASAPSVCLSHHDVVLHRRGKLQGRLEHMLVAPSSI
jgi:hypothetical protein